MQNPPRATQRVRESHTDYKSWLLRFWWRLWLGNSQCPGFTKDDCATLWACDGTILILKLEKEIQCFFRSDKSDLTADRIHRVVRERICPNVKGNEATVAGQLPLVISDYAKLQQRAEILLQRKDLPQSPLYCERLAGIEARPLAGCLGSMMKLIVCE